MKSHFHMKRWALRLALRKRLKVIRKWSIAFESELDEAMENFYRAHDDYHRPLTEERQGENAERRTPNTEFTVCLRLVSLVFACG